MAKKQTTWHSWRLNSYWVQDRMEAARDKDCPPETLAKFAKDDSKSVRFRVAENPKFPAYLLKNSLTMTFAMASPEIPIVR